jgi:hypothetical protein
LFDDTRSTLSNHDQTTVRGLVEPSETDGFAIASLVCGLLGLVPLAIIFGRRALVRIGRSGRSGRGLAITGLVLSVVWLGLGVGLMTTGPKHVTQAAPGPDHIQGMAIGDCLDADGEQVIRAACDAPHDEQIADRVDVSGGYKTYPGLATLEDLAQPLCRIAGAAYFTKDAPPDLEFLAHIPTESSWNAGAREATCTFGKASGKLTGPVRP